MRNRWIGLALAVLLLPAADWLACRALQYRMRNEYASWIATIGSQGWAVHSDAVNEGGFPAGATLTITGLDLSGGRALLPGGLDWRADRVVLTLPLLHFWRLKVEPEGQQVIRIAGTKAVTCFADALSADVPLGRGRADRIAFRVDGLTAGLLQSPQRQDVRIDHLALDLKANRKNSARITAEATIDAAGVELPDNGRWPLGALVRQISATLDIASPALSGVAAAEQARAWHDWGGSLTVPRLIVRWGPMDLRATARLHLDDALQPAGDGSATIGGWAQTVDALAAGGTIPDGMAQTIKMVMGLMARAPRDSLGRDGVDGAGEGLDNGQDVLTVPFTLKDSTLSAGKIPLIRLHDVRWGGV